MEERSIFLELAIDLACTVGQNWRKNVVKHVRCKAWSRAGTLMIAI